MIAKLTHARFHYGWIIAAITFLSLLTAAGMRSTPGVLIVPLEHEFGWNRATVSLAISINLFVYGLCGPFSAALMERFGIRPVQPSDIISRDNVPERSDSGHHRLTRDYNK